MKTLLRKLWFLFDSKEKIKIFTLFLITLGGTLLEILGIGMILPFIALLGAPETAFNNKYINFLYNFLGLDSIDRFLVWMGCGIIVIYIFKNLYLFMMTCLQARFLNKKYLQLSSKLFNSYLHAPYTFHLQRNTAQLLRNLGIVFSVIQGMFYPILVIMTEATVMVAIFAFLVISDPLSSVVVMISLALLMSGFYILIKNRLRVLGEVQKYHSGRMIQQVNQGLGSIKETIILGREQFFYQAYRNDLSKITKATFYQQIVSQSPRFYIEMTIICIVMSIVIMTLLSGIAPHNVLMTISMFAVGATRLMPGMTRISGALSSIRFYIPSLEEVYQDLMNCEKISIEDKNSNVKKRITFNNKIELNNVSYIYENANTFSLSDISIEIKKGSTVGFVGPSGAGKTTIVDVVLGLLKPQSGKVVVDGVDITENIHSWQQQIGYIPQQIYLSDDSIRNNVAFGLPTEEIDEERVWESLRLSQLENFVRWLPKGLDTVVGERGTRLSGGQRQRIGIARALYNRPEILVMDEATAALDNETEKIFMESIAKFKGKKTMLLIAHRLTTVQGSDVIFFLKDGKLKGVGNYKELLERNSEFSRMACEHINAF